MTTTLGSPRFVTSDLVEYAPLPLVAAYSTLSDITLNQFQQMFPAGFVAAFLRAR
jgi:hypothetical protein